eukprot:9341513-Pyramimonas_sp.AAC.1
MALGAAAIAACMYGGGAAGAAAPAPGMSPLAVALNQIAQQIQATQTNHSNLAKPQESSVNALSSLQMQAQQMHALQMHAQQVRAHPIYVDISAPATSARHTSIVVSPTTCSY